MICRRGVRFPAPTHRPRLKNAAQAKASGPGAGHLHTLAAGAGRPLACPTIWRRSPISVAARRLCGGQIPATLPVGRSVSRRRATTRSHPLDDPLLPSGGPIRPASYGRLSCACGAIRFGSARRTAPPLALFAGAQPIFSARFGSQRAALAIRSLPLARKMS